MSAKKRQKTNAENQSSNPMTITKFEQLPNELISMCFNYFYFHELYETFFSLNQRFNQLLFGGIHISIDLDSVPNENLLTFCFQLHDFLSKSQNHSLAIRTSDEQKLSLIINDKLFYEKVTRLKSVSLLSSWGTRLVPCVRFNERMTLYQSLERLTLHEIREREYNGNFRLGLCSELISSKLPSLKYLNISFYPYDCGCPYGDQNGDRHVQFEFGCLPAGEKPVSNLETLIIGNIFETHSSWATTLISFRVLTKELLPRLPKLSKLMINAVDFDEYRELPSMEMQHPTADSDAEITLNLKIIKIWTNTNGRYEHAEERNQALLKKFFLNSNSSNTTIQTFLIDAPPSPVRFRSPFANESPCQED